jgi:hypothetical protein
MELIGWSVRLSEELLLNNECSGSIEGGKYLDQLGDYQLVKKRSRPWFYLISFRGD